MLKKILIISTLFGSTLFAKTLHYDFEKTSLLPWHTYGTWKITQNAQNKILSMMQRSQGSFNLCYTKNVSFLDGTISVKFKANTGHIDQGGGVMWRVQDNDNYYVARFNPLEDNFRFYIVKNGYRSELASANITLPSGWHTMRIEQKGTHFKGYLDDKKYLDYTDSQLRQAGGVGVWTKADAATSFDNLTIHTDK
jgi:hypothetical protein